MRKMRHILFLVLAAFTLAACTQDELAEQGTALPEGVYPLVFTAAQLPPTELQTRVTDNGNASSWEDDDQIVVSMGGKQAVYTYKNGTWSSNSPLYWESTTPQTVTAWYPVDETIDFTHQDQGLAYLMKGECEGEVSFNTTANLTFTHQLAKVRVLLDGEKASEVADVTVRSYPQSANNQGELGDRMGDPVYVPMLKTEYDGKPCWEATLRDGYFEADNTFEVAKEGGIPVRVTLAKDKIPVTAGEVTTITIGVKQAPIDLDTYEGTTLTVSGKTTIKGDGTTSKDLQITVEADAEVTLENVVLQPSALGNAITCNGDATITLVGNNNLTAKSNGYIETYGSGIYVKSGTLTINGNGNLNISREYASDYWSVGAGIGAGSGANIVIESGNISIGDVPDDGSSSGAGIGSTPEENCGNITIKGGTISIGKPSWYSACIGSAANSSCGDITISGESTVITFTQGDYAPCGIGNGDNGKCGTVTVGDGATVNGVKYTETHTGTL